MNLPKNTSILLNDGHLSTKMDTCWKGNSSLVTKKYGRDEDFIPHVLRQSVLLPIRRDKDSAPRFGKEQIKLNKKTRRVSHTSSTKRGYIHHLDWCHVINAEIQKDECTNSGSTGIPGLKKTCLYYNSSRMT